jgi:putative thioredoxin
MNVFKFLSIVTACTLTASSFAAYQGQVVELNSRSQINQALSTTPFVIIDLYAHWCRPCQMMSPVLHSIVQRRPDVAVIKVNADSSMHAVTGLMSTRSLPTIAFFKNGSKVAEFTGARSDAQMMVEVARLF